MDGHQEAILPTQGAVQPFRLFNPHTQKARLSQHMNSILSVNEHSREPSVRLANYFHSIVRCLSVKRVIESSQESYDFILPIRSILSIYSATISRLSGYNPLCVTMNSVVCLISQKVVAMLVNEISASKLSIQWWPENIKSIFTAI